MTASEELFDVQNRLNRLELDVSQLRADRDRLKETVLGLMETVHPFPDLPPVEYERLSAAGASSTLHDILADAERELTGIAS